MKNKGLDISAAKERLLDAALDHVAFEGWSDATFRAAAGEAGIAPDVARVICPRGALDLAVAYHRRGDARMAEALANANLGGMRFRDKVTLAVRLRLEASDREAARRGAALFALPPNAVTGAALIWGTANAIWRALGDRSDDINWYSKRATLSAVYSATVLFWLGDESEGQRASWEFLDRRVGEVMQFEKIKARVRENPVLARVLAGPLRAMQKVRAPAHVPPDLPGRAGEGDGE
ncbi:MAG: COQ9 family protein [Paracoccaceae bacterium]